MKIPLSQIFDIHLEFLGTRLETPDGFSDKKGDDNYWLDVVRQFWDSTNFDIDEIHLRAIINWFDDVRKINN